MKINFTNQFRKDFKLLIKQNKDILKLFVIMATLSNNQTIDKKYQDHALFGEYIGCRECHIEPDWLLVYEIDQLNQIITFYRTGSHSYLF